MNTNSVTVSPTPGNILDDFEEAYQKCLGPLMQEDPFTCVDLAELQTNAETNASHFLELARSMQAFFLQKRFQLSAQKPELVMLEDVVELKSELARKDELIEKHHKKLADWQTLLSNIESKTGGLTTSNISHSTPEAAIQSPANTVSKGGRANPTNVGGNRGGMMAQSNISTPQTSYIGGSMGYNNASGVMANTQMQSAMDTSNGVRGASLPMGGNSSPLMMGGGVNSPSAMMGASQVAGSMGGYTGTNYGPVRGPNPQGEFLHGPLAYLEKTTTNIGMP